MQKQKVYDWKDSNMALFGSDTERKVKKESAESEPAWKAAGEKVGVQVWRIVKFKVEHWNKESYGEFFEGDSYIILNTFKEEDEEEFNHDVHFWIGKYSTQDEYATAAYKTVELDTLLDDKPIQHREVQGHESPLFKSYFTTITLLKGGAETGFRHVVPETYTPRLIHVKREDVIVKGKKKKLIKCTEVNLTRENLNSDDVFIIDMGRILYQFNGSKCSADEKFKAAAEVSNIRNSRGNAQVEILEESSTPKNHSALSVLKEGESDLKVIHDKGQKKMFQVSDEDGRLKMTEIASGDAVSKELLGDDDVYIITTVDHCYCWIGEGASIEERRNGLPYASNYLNKTVTPYLPISVIKQGEEPHDFQIAF